MLNIKNIINKPENINSISIGKIANKMGIMFANNYNKINKTNTFNENLSVTPQNFDNIINR